MNRGINATQIEKINIYIDNCREKICASHYKQIKKMFFNIFASFKCRISSLNAAEISLFDLFLTAFLDNDNVYIHCA